MLKKFAVIGGGSWGTALACLVARVNGHVTLHTIEDKAAVEINDKRQNTKYLGEVELPSGIKATTNLKDVLESDVIIIAVPSHVFEQTLQDLKKLGVSKDKILLIATKGLCENPSQLFSEKIESELDNSYAFVSGPNFAQEVAEDKFTSVTISSKDLELAKNIAAKLASAQLDVTISDDIITVQIASIVKNIIAIKSGMMQASGAGENAKAWLISRGLKEIAMLSWILGGQGHSLSLPAVVGDLVLTGYSTTSRNTKFGYAFHQNNYSKEFLDNYPTLVEGVASARLLKNFLEARKIELDLPEIESIFEIV